MENEITKGFAIVDGIGFETEKKEIVSCNIITVEAGTTGHRGGDSGHGCRTIFKITDEASTDIRCKVECDSKEHVLPDITNVEIMLGGDCELDTFIEALEFAAETLRRQANR